MIAWRITKVSTIISLCDKAAVHIEERVISKVLDVILRQEFLGYEVADEMKEFLETIKCEKMKRGLL